MSDELTPLRRAQHMHRQLPELDEGIRELLHQPDAQLLNPETLKQLNAAQLVHEAQAALHKATLLNWAAD